MDRRYKLGIADRSQRKRSRVDSSMIGIEQPRTPGYGITVPPYGDMAASFPISGMGQPTKWNYSGTQSQYNIKGFDTMQMLKDRRKQRFFSNPTSVAYYSQFRPDGMSDEQWDAALNAYLEDQIYPNMMSNSPVAAFSQWLPAWMEANPPGEATGIQQSPFSSYSGGLVNQRY